MGGIAEFERGLIQALSALDYGQKRVIADRFAAGESMADLAILDANPSTRL